MNERTLPGKFHIYFCEPCGLVHFELCADNGENMMISYTKEEAVQVAKFICQVAGSPVVLQ